MNSTSAQDKTRSRKYRLRWWTLGVLSLSLMLATSALLQLIAIHVTNAVRPQTVRGAGIWLACASERERRAETLDRRRPRAAGRDDQNR